MSLSLPHWVAFWADGKQLISYHYLSPEVPEGYLTSVIDYAHKIDELFSKMDGVRTNAHPLNRHPIISYLNFNWEFVRSLVAPFLPLQPAQDDREKFKPYLEAEEARLEGTLRAVDYVIDGMDTLTLVTGVGRIEKVSSYQCRWRMPTHLHVADGVSSVIPADEAPLRDYANYANESP
jgi:hypothetical protein